MKLLKLFFIIVTLLMGVAMLWLTDVILKQDVSIWNTIVNVGLIWIMFIIMFGSLAVVIDKIDKS